MTAFGLICYHKRGITIVYRLRLQISINKQLSHPKIEIVKNESILEHCFYWACTDLTLFDTLYDLNIV